jgi:hypothetical protein
VKWAVAERALPGETQSGDLSLVEPFQGGVLLAAVDGLGHGAEAANAAQVAAEILRSHAGDGPLALVKDCHVALERTRGAVMSLASFNSQDGTLAWIGIGNVRGLLVRADPGDGPARESLLLRGGVVGYNLPALGESLLTVAPGDILVFATDGIAGDFVTEMVPLPRPQVLADRILARWGMVTDDALVLVARFTRGAA